MAIYNKKEEFFNTITHGVGFILSVIALIFSLVLNKNYDTFTQFIGLIIFTGALVIQYATSAAYHYVNKLSLKLVLRIFDHIAVYILIASTCTPIFLLKLSGFLKWILFIGLWLISILGSLLELTFLRNYRLVMVSLCILDSSIILIAIKQIIENIEYAGLLFIFFGGLSYLIGTIFYLFKNIPYHHAIWHVFVLMGSGIHFYGIFYYVII